MANKLLLISHLNCGNSELGTGYLKDYQSAYEGDVHVISLNEPHIDRRNRVKDLKNFQVYNCKTDGKPGAAIAIKGNVSFLPAMQLCSADCMVGQVILPNGIKFYIISIYMRPQQSVAIQDSLETLQKVLDALGHCRNMPVVICSDTNCRSHRFGESSDKTITDNRGELLYDFMIDNSIL